MDGEYCHICRRPATAVWHGDGEIAVCPTCAVEALPCLIADAIELPICNEEERSKFVFERVTATFWRAMTHRLFRERKQK